MIKLALTDLDDTLIKNGLPHVSERGSAAIHALLDAGLHFAPVSGRIPSAMGWMFDYDEALYSCAALSNGQMIYVDGRLVHAETISGELLEEVARMLTETGDTALCMYDVDAPDENASGYFVSADDAHLDRMAARFRHIKGRAAHLTEPTYIKANIWCAGSRERLERVRDDLRERFCELDFVFPSPTAPLLDISPHGWDKGTATRYLAGELGCDLSEVAVFGDSENDLSMLLAVPNSVAVANASPEVARVAHWHIGPAADDAVADALADIARAAATGSMPSFMREA